MPKTNLEKRFVPCASVHTLHCIYKNNLEYKMFYDRKTGILDWSGYYLASGYYSVNNSGKSTLSDDNEWIKTLEDMDKNKDFRITYYSQD